MPRLIVLGVLVVVLASCSSGDGSGSASSTVTTAPGTTAILQDFAAVTMKVTDASGGTHQSCVLVADDGAKRERGLMDVDSLGGYDGMIFRFSQPTQSSFYMFHTRLPLTVAFFDERGGFVSATDMPPCTATRGQDCPSYPPAGPYLNALEVLQGGLPALGIATGSRIDVGGSCSR
jgi:uncharacterized membrane protein (UPF0127 family)